MATSTSTRYYSLDFWRGIACLMIVAYHASFYVLENPEYQSLTGFDRLIFRMLDHLWVGVPVFFVISGYCITAACDGSREREFSIKSYFRRRVRRIYPPYFGALLFMCLVMGVLAVTGTSYLLYDAINPLHSTASLSFSQWIGNLTLTEVWRSNVWGDKTWFLLGAAWSLCYEEQFYLICGLVMLATRRWFFHAMLALTLVITGITATRLIQGTFQLDGFFWNGRWLEFAAGIGLYYAVQTARDMRWVRLLFGAAFLTAGIIFLWLWKDNKLQFCEEMYASCFFAALVLALFPYDRTAFASPLLRPIWFCGAMCYSLYLTHTVVVKIVSHFLYDLGVKGPLSTLLITVPYSIFAAALVGWLFYDFVERRFLNTPPIAFEELRRPAMGASAEPDDLSVEPAHRNSITTNLDNRDRSRAAVE